MKRFRKMRVYVGISSLDYAKKILNKYKKERKEKNFKTFRQN